MAEPRKKQPSILAVANHKGGVGKTTFVSSLGSALHALGHRVLLVDMDAQANLTDSLGVNANRTVFEALRDKSKLPVYETAEGMSVVPSAFDLASLDAVMAKRPDKAVALRNLLSVVSGDYDFIIIDCPPALGLPTLQAFTAASQVLVPLVAEAFPLKGLLKLEEVIEAVKTALNPNLRLGGIVFSKWDNRRLNRQIEQALRRKYRTLVYDTNIRSNIAIAEAQLQGQSIMSYAPDSNGATDFSNLAAELCQRIQPTLH